ncbi:GTP 3',8-cyclase MoaA [Calderihabitans maritimus]|uniref:GTP 3',8-cyclase n=1 Tax=Calderihabitans maritimus TaxID=1246530 RepID=A0A1Z5HR68_9FIRM|nr:GTP 3',8-cyclase MoaA [Calderihabitans maritimus]GAW92026.1 molybdenum cofactor biosynthesis enzyme [Calderihabitans maritimus]
MQDRFQREINYLRISITDRCNLRCVYCMPPEGVKLVEHEDILRLEEIETIVRAAAAVGIRKLRLTGGEPLIRKGIVRLVRKLSAVPGIDDLALTTNGILLARYLKSLEEAGLNRVNISLDTLRPERFKEITRGGNLTDVWQGIKAALASSLHPVKLNTVIIRGSNDDEILDFARLTMEFPLHVRFIELMPIGTCNAWAEEKRVPYYEIKEQIEKELGSLVAYEEVPGGGPAKYYRLPGALGTIGFITAMSNHFCNHCNRIRLTAQGQIRPCLHSEWEIDLKGPLRQGAREEELQALISQAIQGKPRRHSMDSEGWQDQRRSMFQIGG